jgi:hypothetical protein
MTTEGQLTEYGRGRDHSSASLNQPAATLTAPRKLVPLVLRGRRSAWTAAGEAWYEFEMAHIRARRSLVAQPAADFKVDVNLVGVPCVVTQSNGAPVHAT